MPATNDTFKLSKSVMTPEMTSALTGAVYKGLSGIFQHQSLRKQEEAAREMQRMTGQLGMVELLMEKQRQDVARAAMAETLESIDEEYGLDGSPRALRNRAIIQGMIAQLGRTAARPAAEAASKAGEARSLAGRRMTAAGGVGGSVAESMSRSLVGARAAEREAVATTREGAEYAAGYDVRRRRAEARKRATGLLDVSGARIQSPYEAAMQSVMAQSAVAQEGLRHMPALIGTGMESIAGFVKDLYSASQKTAAQKEQKMLEEARRRQVVEALGFV